MAKVVLDAVMDAALNEVKNNATTLHVCALQPTSRADAITKSLANVAITSTDFTLANGDASGRKSTCAAQTGISIGSSGDADHIAVIDGTRLLVVTTCATQTLTSGGTVDTNAWDHEIADAV